LTVFLARVALALWLLHGSALAVEPLSTCKRSVTIDVGHTPSAPGAISAGGRAEYGFNWRLADDLASRLKAAGWSLQFTVQPGEDISLSARAIGKITRGLLLSLHHDSVQPRYLVHHGAGQRGPVSFYASGFSLFVKTDGHAAEKSLATARAIGSRLAGLGRKPSLHHAERIPGENRHLLDASLGVYEFNGLAVLRSSRIPAVLVEAAVIVNPYDEAWISDSVNRGDLAQAVVNGLNDICPVSWKPPAKPAPSSDMDNP
jgi:N-acetylmuramoyl-L-alanine amidase